VSNHKEAKIKLKYNCLKIKKLITNFTNRQENNILHLDPGHVPLICHKRSKVLE